MSNKEQIRKVLKEIFSLRYRIKTKAVPKSEMDKRAFIDIITTIKEINERTEFMASELGIDNVGYDDLFFRVIEDLMRIAFTKKQVMLIEMYLNEIQYMKEDWDGTITVNIGSREEVVQFETPEDVWNAIQKFE